MAVQMDERERQKTLEEFYNRGLVAVQSEQYDYAIHLFRSALELDPNFARAHEGIRHVRKAKFQKGSVASQRFRCVGFLLGAFVMERMKKWDKALEKYENLMSLMRPPAQLLPHLGDCYWGSQMTDNAVSTYRAVLEHDGSNVYALRQLGRLLMETGQIQEARPVYDRLSEVAGGDGVLLKEIKDALATITISVGHWEEEGSLHQKLASDAEASAAKADAPEEEEEKGEYSKPVRMARSQVRDDPDNVPKRMQLARLYEQEKHVDEAIEEYTKIKELRPDDMDIRQRLADFYSGQQQFGKAATEYDEMLAVRPDPAVRKKLAEMYEKHDNALKATETYEKLVEETPEDAEALETLAKLYIRTRFFEKALAAYERVLELQPERAEIHETVGNLYLRQDQREKAVARYEKVIELKPDNVAVQNALGGLYMQKHLLPQAAGCFRKVVELEPENAQAQARLREIEIGDLEDTVREWEKKVQESPDDETAKREFADARKKQVGMLVEDREERVARAPDNYKARFELGNLYHEKGELDRALEQFQVCARSEDYRTQAWNMIGLCFEGKEMFDLAVRQLEQAADAVKTMTEQKKEILYNLGRIYDKMKQYEKAGDQYKKIYEVDISYRDVGTKIQDAYRRAQAS